MWLCGVGICIRLLQSIASLPKYMIQAGWQNSVFFMYMAYRHAPKRNGMKVNKNRLICPNAKASRSTIAKASLLAGVSFALAKCTEGWLDAYAVMYHVEPIFPPTVCSDRSLRTVPPCVGSNPTAKVLMFFFGLDAKTTLVDMYCIASHCIVR